MVQAESARPAMAERTSRTDLPDDADKAGRAASVFAPPVPSHDTAARDRAGILPDPVMMMASTAVVEAGRGSSRHALAHLATLAELRAELAQHVTTNHQGTETAERRERLLGRLQDEAAERDQDEREKDRIHAHLYRSTQEERLRLARDLHDHAGQHVMSLRLGLVRLKRHVSDEAGRIILSSLVDQVDLAARDLHRLTTELRPAALEEFGLPVALQTQLEEWGQSTGIAVSFTSVGGPVHLRAESEVTLFRLAQEALTNVAKHATGARSVTMVLQYASAHVALTIEDDGCGFQQRRHGADPTVAGTHFGLAGMRERLSLVGGEFEIETTSGRGTTLFARILTTGMADAA